MDLAIVSSYGVLTEELKSDYVIRCCGNIVVTAANGEAKPAADWVVVTGRARTLPAAAVTAERIAAGAEVCVQDKGMRSCGAWPPATRMIPLAT